MQSEEGVAASLGTICETIRLKIIGGVLMPGDRLYEDSLADDFGVSRVPIREAFRILEGQGFLTSRKYSGTVVSDPTPEEVTDFFRIRCVLEPLAARQAAERRTRDQMVQVNEIVREARRALRARRASDVASINSQFHELVAVASGNAGLLEMIRQVRFRTDRFNQISTQDRAAHTIREHVEIAKALEVGDAVLAERLASAHAQSEANAYHLKRSEDLQKAVNSSASPASSTH